MEDERGFDSQRLVVVGIMLLLALAFWLGRLHGKQEGILEEAPKIQRLEKRCQDLEESLFKYLHEAPSKPKVLSQHRI